MVAMVLPGVCTVVDGVGGPPRVRRAPFCRSGAAEAFVYRATVTRTDFTDEDSRMTRAVLLVRHAG